MPILADVVYGDDDKPATDGKSSTWPQGEPQKIRDAYDKSQGGSK